MEGVLPLTPAIGDASMLPLSWIVLAGLQSAFFLGFTMGANDVANSFGSSVGAGVWQFFERRPSFPFPFPAKFINVDRRCPSSSPPPPHAPHSCARNHTCAAHWLSHTSAGPRRRAALGLWDQPGVHHRIHL